MTLTKEKQDELYKAAQPLLDFCNDNLHPHCKIIVEQGSVECVEGVCASPFPVKD